MSSSTISVKPMIAARMLLKSWAMPPARVPMASIFWAWRRCSSMRFCSVISLLISRRAIGFPSLSRRNARLLATVIFLPSLVVS